MERSSIRTVKLFTNGRSQAVRIPREFELPGDAALMRKRRALLLRPSCASGPRKPALEKPAELRYAEVRSRLERAGTLIGGNDLLIAAHALTLDLVLVTANVREFEGLRCVDWLQQPTPHHR